MLKLNQKYLSIKLLMNNFPNVEDSVQDQINHAQRVQEAINKGCQGGRYIFHQMVVTNWDSYDSGVRTEDAMLIFKKK